VNKLSNPAAVLRIGNDNLHLLTSSGRQELRIDMADWNGNTRYAVYNNFNVGSEQEKYKLYSIGKYSGNAGQYGTKTYDNRVFCYYETRPESGGTKFGVTRGGN